MDLLTKDELKTLTGEQPSPAISIYMPSVRAGAETQQNSIRFKNLVRQAEERLLANGLPAEQARKFLQPAFDLIPDEPFWQHQSDGLALFLSPDNFRHYRLPLDFEELVVSGGQFHLKPLMPLFSAQGRFYVLALSQNEIRVMEGTRYSVVEIEVKNMPESLEDALQWDDPEKTLQTHEASWGPVGGSTSNPQGIFHGHGTGKDDQKDQILRYFHQVAASMEDFLSEENAPLVLAGVDYLHPIYRKVNRYQHLAEQGIEGSPEELSISELHKRAWKLLEPLFEAEQERAAELYRQQAGMNTGRAANDLNEIVLAAYQGRVEQLFVPLGLEQWGLVDWSSGEIEFHEEQTMENVDLYDVAAVQTFLNGGAVYALEPVDLPEDAPSIAVLRY